jgi:hypothetical protein
MRSLLLKDITIPIAFKAIAVAAAPGTCNPG